MKETPRDALVWRALADPSRRRMLDLLRGSPLTTGALAGEFAFSRFAVMKHLKVLEDAGLVLVSRRGRERFNHLNPTPIQQIYRRWIRPFEAEAADGLLRLKRAVEQEQQQCPAKPRRSRNSGSRSASRRPPNRSGRR